MKLKGYKKENKITTKNMLIAFGIIIILMAVIGIYRTYAIYKLQKEYDVIKSKIGEFNNGDVKVAVLVDGEESSFFPTYEDNYKIESIECTNGVTGQWDVVNWRLIIDDMSATSTKCTISFNSNETNEETPIAYSKEELLALNEEYQNVAYNNLKTQLLNDTYPVGSIYMSTEDDTVEKVQNKFGGTWVKYNEGQMLMSAGTTYAVNSTGGSSTVTLTTENLPSHNHAIPSLSVSSWSGSHSHDLTDGTHVLTAYGSSTVFVGSGGNNAGFGKIKSTTITVSGQTTIESNTTSCTNCNGTKLNIQNPYTAVYMYKRTS